MGEVLRGRGIPNTCCGWTRVSLAPRRWPSGRHPASLAWVLRGAVRKGQPRPRASSHWRHDGLPTQHPAHTEGPKRPTGQTPPSHTLSDGRRSTPVKRDRGLSDAQPWAKPPPWRRPAAVLWIARCPPSGDCGGPDHSGVTDAPRPLPSPAREAGFPALAVRERPQSSEVSTR